MLGRLLLITIILIAHLSHASSTARLIVPIKSAVELDKSSGEISIGDLVVTRGLDEKVIDALNSLRLADLPQAGETRTFTDIGILEAFKPHMGLIEELAGRPVSLRAPSRVNVVRKSFKLKPDAVKEELRQHFSSLCADCEFEFTGLNLPVVPRSISGSAQWKLRLRPELPKGSFNIAIDITDQDSSSKTYWIAGTLATYRKVPVATRALMMGERLQPEDYALQKKDVTFATDFPPGESEINSSVVGRSVSAGQVIWRGNLRREMAVKMGDIVRVTAGSEEWQVSLDGVAQGSAYIGDLVRVKIPRTQKMISGLLKEKGLVEVR